MCGKKSTIFLRNFRNFFFKAKKFIFENFWVSRRKSDILNTEFIPPQYIYKKKQTPLYIYMKGK